MAPLERLQRGGVTALALPLHGQRLEPAGDGLAMSDPRLGGDDDPGTGDLAAPRQVQVLAHGHDPGIETLELSEEVGADEDAPRGRDEDVADGVVLAMVDLTLEDPVDDGAGLVATHADVEQDARVVPVDELRRDDPGVGAERLLDQLVDGVAVQGHVVVAQQVEGGALDHAQRLVGGGGVAGAPGEMADEGVGEDPAHPLGDLRAVLARVEDQDRQLLVVLRRQGGERLFEPGSGVGRDHDGDHRRHLGVHQHLGVH